MEPNQDSFEPSSDMHSKKGKGNNSLRISDIMKLKDNGNADCSRIIQPGCVRYMYNILLYWIGAVGSWILGKIYIKILVI